jgi:hypothetical protein
MVIPIHASENQFGLNIRIEPQVNESHGFSVRERLCFGWRGSVPGVMEKSAIDSLAEFRCAGWDEGCEEGAGSGVLVAVIK